MEFGGLRGLMICDMIYMLYDIYGLKLKLRDPYGVELPHDMKLAENWKLQRDEVTCCLISRTNGFLPATINKDPWSLIPTAP